jgi:hypothetical protein
MWVAVVVPLLVGAFALVMQQVEARLDPWPVETPAAEGRSTARGRQDTPSHPRLAVATDLAPLGHARCDRCRAAGGAPLAGA